MLAVGDVGELAGGASAAAVRAYWQLTCPRRRCAQSIRLPAKIFISKPLQVIHFYHIFVTTQSVAAIRQRVIGSDRWRKTVGYGKFSFNR